MFGRQRNAFVNNPFAYVESYIADADVLVFNLETVISEQRYIPESKRVPKVFNYQSLGKQLLSLRRLTKTSNTPIFASMNNNHSYDYGPEGYATTKHFLDKRNFLTTTALRSPAIAAVPRGSSQALFKKIAFFSATDHPAEWKQFVPFLQPGPLASSLRSAIARQANKGRLIIFSIHWGPNYLDSIPDWMESRGRDLIDAGVDIVFGHSAHHVPPGNPVQRYKHGVIIYGLGDFVNDYAVDPKYQSDRALMCSILVQAPKTLGQITLHRVQRKFVDAGSSVPFPVGRTPQRVLSS